MNIQSLFGMENKTALITGAASGTGKGIAKAFAALGCAVAIVDIDKNMVNQLETEIKQSEGKAIGIECDVTKADDVKSAVETAIKALGGLDILVNNAGIGKRSKAEEMTDDQWDSVIDVNLKGSFLFCREAGKAMIARGKGGRIINMASITAIVGVETGNANYAASKGGIVSMGRCLAVEWAKHQILVNTIVPTHIRTPLIEKLIQQDQETEKYFLNNILLGRLGEVDDLIGPTVFLASDSARFITGQTIVVDGGHTAK